MGTIDWTYNSTAGPDVDIIFDMDWQWYEELEFLDLQPTVLFSNLEKLD